MKVLEKNNIEEIKEFLKDKNLNVDKVEVIEDSESDKPLIIIKIKNISETKAVSLMEEVIKRFIKIINKKVDILILPT